MGLTVTHNCWNEPYSSFNRFRHSLAHQIGINLDEYVGYNENGTKNLSEIQHDLMPLFNHSDCEGKLTLKQSRMIVKGFNSVLENFNESIPADYDFKDKIIKFRDGLLLAISKKQIVYFK